jgi:hypothetical protein
MEREVLAARKRVMGAEHPDKLNAAGNLALSLSGQRKYAEAEKMQREELAVRKPRAESAVEDSGVRKFAHLSNYRGKRDLL